MHRERPLDFWLTVATVISLFIPIWGVLLAPSELVNYPIYLYVMGGLALAVVISVLIYAKLRNRVLLNRFVTGYIGGLLGTGVIQLFLQAGVLVGLTPNLVYALGNLTMGQNLHDAPSTSALIVGVIYHFLLNGAAWGAAYALLIGKARWWYGAFYGMGICAVLMISPVFYALKFPQLAATQGPLLIIMMLVAHIAYGSVIGYIVYRYAFPEVGIEGSKAVRPAYS